MKFQRNTRQREVISEELRKLTSHPTAVTLYGIVRSRLPKISLGTVYRNLELLSEMGLIQKLEITGAEARFDGNPQRHCHVRCIRCERVDDVHEPCDRLVDKDIKELDGYTIVGYRLDFFGVCPQCRKQTDGANNLLREP